VHIDAVTGGTLAIEATTKVAVKKLMKDMIKAWNETLNNGDEFRVEVRNLSDSVDMYKIEKDIASIKSVTAVIMDKYDGGTAHFRVMHKGTVNDLAKKLEANLKLKGISGKKVVMEKK